MMTLNEITESLNFLAIETLHVKHAAKSIVLASHSSVEIIHPYSNGPSKKEEENSYLINSTPLAHPPIPQPPTSSNENALFSLDTE
jgi:hypothetical protein